MVARSRLARQGSGARKPERLGKVTKAQELEFQIISNATFNNFDGPYVVKKLKENDDLWESVVSIDEGTSSGNKYSSPDGDLIVLRDLPINHIHADSMFIIAKEGKEENLLNLVTQNFHADEVTWLDEDEASSRVGQHPFKKKVLRVWWD